MDICCHLVEEYIIVLTYYLQWKYNIVRSNPRAVLRVSVTLTNFKVEWEMNIMETDNSREKPKSTNVSIYP